MQTVLRLEGHKHRAKALQELESRIRCFTSCVAARKGSCSPCSLFKKCKVQVDTWMHREAEKDCFGGSAEVPKASLLLLTSTDKARQSAMTESRCPLMVHP